MQILPQILDPVTLMAILLGCCLVALVQNGLHAFLHAFGALPVLWRAKPARDMAMARATVSRIDHVAQLRGLQCTDRVRSANAFLAMAIRRLADTDTVERFEIWTEQTLADRRQRHETVHKVWLSIADAAPALGMAGTIIGLVAMFAGMDDPSKIGPAMALALLTTLYGVVIANLIAAPIATRFADLSERELAWQTELCERMLRVARRETAPVRRSAIREVA